ncbi:MAG TPA: DUF1326 domain-containing protein [Solirubrobacteraceae bacterium]|jgi:hypothetical protein
MPWQLEGRYFENCSCDVPCPCTVSLDFGADRDRCNAFLVFQVDEGEVDGVDVGGLTVAAMLDTPKVMSEGNWRLGVLIDERATDEQAEKLGAVFGGQLGGPMEALGPLVGEQLGVERVPMEVSHENGTHRIELGDTGVVEVREVVPFGLENGAPARLAGVFHPAGDTLTIARATRSQVSAFGIDFAFEGGSGFANPFRWAA